jgi:hypothetical protein
MKICHLAALIRTNARFCVALLCLPSGSIFIGNFFFKNCTSHSNVTVNRIVSNFWSGKW